MKKQVHLILSGMLCLMVSHSLFGNDTKPLFQKEELLKVIRDISFRYDVHFTYDREIVENVVVDNYSPDAYSNVDDALAKVLSNTKLKYVMLEMKYVIIYRDDAAGMESLQQMVKVLQTIIDEKKEANSSLSIQLLTKEADFKDIHLERHRMVLNIKGQVKDAAGQPLIGVNVLVKGSNQGTATDFDGNFELNDVNENATLVFSYIGYQSQEVVLNGRSNISVTLLEDSKTLDEIVVVGYGTQKKKDITGSVSRLSDERLDLVPNLNIAQAIQGAIPGVLMQTTTGGAVSEQSIMIRGRNSILADNSPLIVVDGIVYTGELKDLNPNDVLSIEILKDASAAAIYGSRGANGVILISTKIGSEGKPKISYNGYYSVQNFVKFPDLMDGEEFYNFKSERGGQYLTHSEKEVYSSGKFADWINLALQKGNSTEHNISISGGSHNTRYYLSGGLLNVNGLAVNDKYRRLSYRVNLETDITDWLKIGTRTQISYDDLGGLAPRWTDETGVFSMNPLTIPYDDNGNLTIHPWSDDTYFPNPLQNILAKNNDQSDQIISNNYVEIKFPFIPNLKYRIDAGVKIRHRDIETYYGRDTESGFSVGGSGNADQFKYNSVIIQNILDYSKSFGAHSIAVTGVYSFESDKYSDSKTYIKGFPHDFLSFYSVGQAEIKEPSYSFMESNLISQMLRMNYSFNSRYLVTLTGRRDGYSGFGRDEKWGIFPSVAIGWNLVNENFFPWKQSVNDFKIRMSYGLNGNQAVDPYQTISKLEQSNYISGSNTLAGYFPSNLAVSNLGWESAKTFNLGLDVGVLNNRIYGDFNYYVTNTFDLLLNRTISPIHGFNSTVQNIGSTRNIGLEASISSFNIETNNFRWNSNFNISWMKNEIVSLYGELNDDGSEIDDISNNWYIGQPIQINFGYVWNGIWQIDESDVASKYNTEPGFIKIKDVNQDGKINSEDREIVGQRDPKILWGMMNSFTFREFTLSIFFHGVHGNIKSNSLLLDERTTGVEIRRNITRKDFWTPNNPNASNPINREGSWIQSGVTPMPLEKAGFVRLKDVTLSYDIAMKKLKIAGIDKCRFYLTGRNYLTITKWTGLDPELDGQISIPLQKELVFGLNIGL